MTPVNYLVCIGSALRPTYTRQHCCWQLLLPTMLPVGGSNVAPCMVGILLCCVCYHDVGSPRWGGWVFAAWQPCLYSNWNCLYPTKASGCICYDLYSVHVSMIIITRKPASTVLKLLLPNSKHSSQQHKYMFRLLCFMYKRMLTQCKMLSGFHSGSVR